MLEKIMNEIFRVIGMVVVAMILLAMIVFGLFGVTAQILSASVVAIFGVTYIVTVIYPKIIKGNKKVKKEGN